MSTAVDTRKRCTRCRRTRAASSFTTDTSRPDGKFPWCRDCQNDARAESWFQDETAEPNGRVCPLDDVPIRGHANRRYCSEGCKNRVTSLRSKYGLAVEDYRRMVAELAGRCPLCQNRVRQWHVDHNHRTRRVTGPVCLNCNVGALAATFHDVGYVRRLLAYLEYPTADRLGIDALAPVEATRPSNLHRVWNRADNRRRNAGRNAA